jgi:hypothetical protein
MGGFIMSHFSTLKVQVKNLPVANPVFLEMGFTPQFEKEYRNPFSSSELVKNCQVIRDVKGKVKFVIAENGDVIHDAFYMGREATVFLRKYSEAYIRYTASREGATVKNLGEDTNGNIVLEVAYAYA